MCCYPIPPTPPPYFYSELFIVSEIDIPIVSEVFIPSFNQPINKSADVVVINFH